jgi:hypothetical protein
MTALMEGSATGDSIIVQRRWERRDPEWSSDEWTSYRVSHLMLTPAVTVFHHQPHGAARWSGVTRPIHASIRKEANLIEFYLLQNMQQMKTTNKGNNIMVYYGLENVMHGGIRWKVIQ